jgi:hypothetical protein
MCYQSYLDSDIYFPDPSNFVAGNVHRSTILWQKFKCRFFGKPPTPPRCWVAGNLGGAKLGGVNIECITCIILTNCWKLLSFSTWDLCSECGFWSGYFCFSIPWSFRNFCSFSKNFVSAVDDNKDVTRKPIFSWFLWQRKRCKTRENNSSEVNVDTMQLKLMHLDEMARRVNHSDKELFSLVLRE